MEVSLPAVLSEVLGTVAESVSPEPGRAVLVPGVEAAWDDCCAGQVAVRIVSLTPVYRGRRGASDLCDLVHWNVTLGVGIVRCIAVVDDHGRAPSAERITADAEQMVADMLAIKNALLYTKFSHVQQLTLGQWVPQGAEGACAGGEWVVNFLLPVCVPSVEE